MYERAKVGWEMLSCFLLGLTIYLFSDGSGDSNGSGYLDGSGDLDSSGNSDGSGYLDGSEDLDSSGDSEGYRDSDSSDEVGKSTKLAQFLFKIYKIGRKVFSQLKNKITKQKQIEKVYNFRKYFPPSATWAVAIYFYECSVFKIKTW